MIKKFFLFLSAGVAFSLSNLSADNEVDFIRPGNTASEYKALKRMSERRTEADKRKKKLTTSMRDILARRFKDNDTYNYPQAELKNIVNCIKKLTRVEHRPKGGILSTYYCDAYSKEMKGIYFPERFDFWIPFPWFIKDEKPEAKYIYEWNFINGRMSDGYLIKRKRKKLYCKIWYNDKHAPVMSIFFDKNEKKPTEYYYGEYDSRGLLRRVSWFDGRLKLRGVYIFVNKGGYHLVECYYFRLTGNMKKMKIEGAEFIYDSLVYDWGARHGRISTYGFAINYHKRLNQYVEFGLNSIYPIPDTKFNKTKKLTH